MSAELSDDEMLDVVDENDNVIRQEPRSKVKAEGLMCRIVQVFVINDKDEILVQWRSRRKSNGPRIFDSSVGGHVDAGEGYDEAAHREMEEEIGIKGDLTKVGKFKDVEGSADKHAMFYTIKHNGPFSNWEKEADKLEWFTLKELEQFIDRLPYLFTGGIKGSVKEYKKFIKKQETK